MHKVLTFAYEPARAAGGDPPARARAGDLDAGRAGRGAARRAASTSCRPRCRATSPSSGSSRCARRRGRLVYAAVRDERRRPAARARQRRCAGTRIARRGRRQPRRRARRRPATRARSRRRSTRAGIPAIAGTIAGDNTIFVAARDGTPAAALRDELLGHLAGRSRMSTHGSRRLLRRPRHELHRRLAEGGPVRLRRGRRRARRRRPGVRPRGVDRPRPAAGATTSLLRRPQATPSPTSSARGRSRRTRCTRASTRSSRRSRAP